MTTLEEKKQQAVDLELQIKNTQQELQWLCNEIVRETFWLKAGDVIIRATPRRQGFLKRIKCVQEYFLIHQITAMEPTHFQSKQAIVWVRPICSDSGAVHQVTGSLMSYQLNHLQRIGHIDDHQTVEHIDLSELTTPL